MKMKDKMPHEMLSETKNVVMNSEFVMMTMLFRYAQVCEEEKWERKKLLEKHIKEIHCET